MLTFTILLIILILVAVYWLYRNMQPNLTRSQLTESRFCTSLLDSTAIIKNIDKAELYRVMSKYDPDLDTASEYSSIQRITYINPLKCSTPDTPLGSGVERITFQRGKKQGQYISLKKGLGGVVKIMGKPKIEGVECPRTTFKGVVLKELAGTGLITDQKIHLVEDRCPGVDSYTLSIVPV